MEAKNRDRFGYGEDGYKHQNQDPYQHEPRYRNNRDMRNQFERDYRDRHDSSWERDQNRYRNYSSATDWNRNSNSNYYSPEQDQGYSRRDAGNYPKNYYRREEERPTGRRPSLGDIRRGYGISDFDGTSDRYDTLGSNQPEGNRQERQSAYGGRGSYKGSRSGGMGEDFPHSNRGIPNYDTRSFADERGSGMGSSYGGKNFGGGTGYTSGNRGGSFGNKQYGTSSGNYGGYGSMGGGTLSSGRGRTSHNSDRGTSELGGF